MPRVGEPGEALEYLGHRITLRRIHDDSSRETLLIRVLAAVSLWGMQEDLWEWTVYDGDMKLAADQELSRLAALEGAQRWVRDFALSQQHGASA